MTITYRTTLVTPQEAENLLARNKRNRAISALRIAQFASMMEQGAWYENGDAIRFDKNGDLMDGQHRLAAVVMSGVSQTFLFVEGLRPEVVHSIDTGRHRSNADMLAIESFKNSAVLAAGGSTFWKLIHGMSPPDVCPAHFLIETVRRWPSLEKWTNTFSNSGTVRGIVPGSVLVPALVYLEEVAGRPDLAAQLFHDVDTGADLMAGDPALAYRNRLIRNRVAGGRMDVSHLWPTTCRLLDAIEADERLDRMQIVAFNGPLVRPEKMAEHLKKQTASRRLSDLKGGVVRQEHTALARKVTADNRRKIGEGKHRTRVAA